MVIEDHSFKESENKVSGELSHADDANSSNANKNSSQFSKEAWPLASPVDRFAACLVDFVILVPLLSLAFAFFKREIFLTELSGTQPALDVMVFVYFGLSVFVVIAFQTVFSTWLGATPGKYFFGLRIVDVWHHGHPHWQRCFLRAVLWWVDVFLVLPFIALFSDIKRRPIHDRLSDTIVLASPSRAVAPPKGYETQLARSFFAALFVFVGGYLLVQSPGFYLAAAKTGFDVSDWVGGKHLCEDVDKSLKAWSLQNIKGKGKINSSPGHRLKVAMSLYGAQQIDSDCLNKEADHFIWIETGEASETGLGYLAKAFAKIDDPQLSDRYLDKVCEADDSSEACRLSQVIGFWSEEKWSEIDKIFATSNLQESTYYKIWEIRHHFKMGSFDKVRDIIESVSPNYALADFLGEYRIKVHWRQKLQSQAESGFKLYWENQAGEGRLPIASWLCYEEMSRGCEGWQTASCEVIQNTISAYPTILEDSKVALAKLRSLQCEGKGVDHVGVIFSEEVLSYGEATDTTTLAREQVFENLMMFAGDQGRSPTVQFDAMTRAVEIATSKKEFEKLVRTWRGSTEKQSWGWKFIGHKLFAQLVNYTNAELAFSVADNLYKQGDHTPQTYESLAHAKYLLGDRSSAFQWLTKVSDVANQRQPASVRRWQSEKESLLKEFAE